MNSGHGRLTGFKSRALRVATYVVLVGWSLVCIIPVYWLLATSLKSETAITDGPYFLPFVDFQPVLDAWYFVLADANENLRQAFINSLLISATSTLVSVLAAGLAIYAATRNMGGSRTAMDRCEHVLTLTLVTRILPPIVLVLPLYVMAQAVSLVDSQLVLIFIYAAVNLPVAVWLLRPILGARATEQEEAAQLDGASHALIFRTVLFPMCIGGFLTVALLVFILCWNEYLFAGFLATDTSMTLAPWMAGQLSIKEAQIAGEAEEWAHMSAVATLMLLPLLLSTRAIQRHLAWAVAWRM